MVSRSPGPLWEPEIRRLTPDGRDVDLLAEEVRLVSKPSLAWN